MGLGLNKVTLIGNLGADPESRSTKNGSSLATFSLATTESFKDREGERKEHTEWHRVVVWGKLAWICQKYLAKGRQVYIEGRLRTRSWQDINGQKRYATEVEAQRVLMLGGAGLAED